MCSPSPNMASSGCFGTITQVQGLVTPVLFPSPPRSCAVLPLQRSGRDGRRAPVMEPQVLQGFVAPAGAPGPRQLHVFSGKNATDACVRRLLGISPHGPTFSRAVPNNSVVPHAQFVS